MKSASEIYNDAVARERPGNAEPDQLAMIRAAQLDALESAIGIAHEAKCRLVDAHAPGSIVPSIIIGDIRKLAKEHGLT